MHNKYTGPDPKKSFTTDDDGTVVEISRWNDDGSVDTWKSSDGFETHSHDVYSNTSTYADSIDAAFSGEDDSGDIYSREADDHPERHPWTDHDGVL